MSTIRQRDAKSLTWAAPGKKTQPQRDRRNLLRALDALVEAGTALNDNAVPQHYSGCAAQDDDEPCICGVTDLMDALRAALAHAKEVTDGA